MPMYRKKPVTIEARQHDGSYKSANDLVSWIGAGSVWHSVVSDTAEKTCSIKIATLEGIMTASPDDFIIKGINGEFYPCKPEIFGKSYDFAEVPDE